MRIRLAEEPPIYSGTRDNFEKGDHAMRTMVTAGMIATIAPKWLLDPACGDASVLDVAYAIRPFEHAALYDISEKQIEVIAPKFPHTKEQRDINWALSDSTRHVDMVVLTEVLEHLQNPDLSLKLARKCSDFLIASSPIGDPEDGRNHEHLWAWDEEGYSEMLRAAGWEPTAKAVLTYPGQPWNCQIWLAR